MTDFKIWCMQMGIDAELKVEWFIRKLRLMWSILRGRPVIYRIIFKGPVQMRVKRLEETTIAECVFDFDSEQYKIVSYSLGDELARWMAQKQQEAAAV